MHKVLHIPFEYHIEDSEFVKPILFEFPNEPIIDNKQITIPQWVSLSFQDSSSLELLLFFYPEYLLSIELLWLFYSYFVKQQKEKTTKEEIEQMDKKFNEIIQQWIKVNFHHEWCCLNEELLNCCDNISFPSTNLQIEALKLVNIDTQSLICSFIPCNSHTEIIDDNIFEPKILFDFTEKQIVQQMSANDLELLKRLTCKDLLHHDNWRGENINNSVLKFTKNFNHLVQVFSFGVIKFHTPESRGLYFSKLIDISHFAAFNETLPNYNLAFIIYYALESSPISRLKSSWSYVTNYNKWFELDRFLTRDKSLLQYRRGIKKTSIVYFGIPLVDITFTRDSNHFYDPNSDNLVLRLNAITQLYDKITNGLLLPLKNAREVELTKTLKFQHYLTFISNEKVLEGNNNEIEEYLYKISTTMEPQGITIDDLYTNIPECLSSVSDSILEIARNEKYFKVREKYVLALLPLSSLENCYSVLKKLSKKRIENLCLKLHDLILQFGCSYLNENSFEDAMDYRMLLIHFDARIINVAKHFNIENNSLHNISDVCPTKVWQKSARK